MKFEIKSRWTGSVVFTAEIEATDATPMSIKLGLTVQAAMKSHADLSGANLSDADLSGACLRGANLSDADLSGACLRGACLRGANLSDANLSDADLSGAYLSDADLIGANLIGANLRGANLSDADLIGANLSGAPFKIENIHQTVYASASQEGALDMSAWHCGTSHCRAGWVVELAGDAGKALEWTMGTPAAAAAIYLASDPNIERFPDFYCGDEAALEDMKARAESEANQDQSQ